MMTPLYRLAHSRTGDKGDTSMISLIAYDPKHFELLRSQVTAEAVGVHFASLEPATVERFELPRLGALNFVLRGVLAGGVTRSLALDAHGKTLSSSLLEMEVQLDPSDPPVEAGPFTRPTGG